MSETTEETTTETTEPAVEPVPDSEPDTELEPDTEQAEGVEQIQHDEEDESTEGEPASEAAVSGPALSEKDIEKRNQQLFNENQRHAKRVGEIMDEDATLLIGCPVCMDGIAGWIFPPEVQQLPEEAIARIRQVVGLPDYSNFEYASWAAQCPECKGKGKVKTYSDVPGREVAGCLRCNEAGWINLNIEKNGHTEVAPQQSTVTGPTVYGTGDPDPRIQALRDEGYFVAPGTLAVQNQ